MTVENLAKLILDHKSILIIDDEAKIRELLEMYLKRTEAEIKNIVHAGDGREALRKLNNQEFDLVIMDIVMPHKSGLKLLEELKSKAKTKQIPILMISGQLEPDIVKNAIVKGARHILAKPFNYQLFLERVCRCLPAT